MYCSGVKVHDHDPNQVYPTRGSWVPTARRVPGGESECVGVYLEMWPDLKSKVCCQRFGPVYVELANEEEDQEME
jgi:hypothetical protein